MSACPNCNTWHCPHWGRCDGHRNLPVELAAAQALSDDSEVSCNDPTCPSCASRKWDAALTLAREPAAKCLSCGCIYPLPSSPAPDGEAEDVDGNHVISRERAEFVRRHGVKTGETLIDGKVVHGYSYKGRYYMLSAPDGEAEGEEPTDLHSTIDAAVWAKEFMRICEKLGVLSVNIDEGWLVGWFANAIMAGYDEARRRYEKPSAPEVIRSATEPLEAEIKRLKLALCSVNEALRTLADTHPEGEHIARCAAQAFEEANGPGTFPARALKHGTRK